MIKNTLPHTVFTVILLVGKDSLSERLQVLDLVSVLKTEAEETVRYSRWNSFKLIVAVCVIETQRETKYTITKNTYQLFKTTLQHFVLCLSINLLIIY